MRARKLQLRDGHSTTVNLVYALTLLSCALTGVALLLPATADAAATQPPAWIRVDKGALAGDLPAPSATHGGLPRSYFKVIEPPAEPRFALVHSDAIETLIFQTRNSTTRGVDYPGDQVVRVLGGTITFTDEPAGRAQTFEVGDYFIVPKHWRGTWQLKSRGAQPARIFVTVEAAGWSASRAQTAGSTVAPTLQPPGMMRVDLPGARARMSAMNFAAPHASPAGDTSTLGNVVFAGEVSLLLLDAPKGASYRRAAARCEATVRVVAGSIVLEDENGGTETFEAEDVFVLTRSFAGTVRMSAGFGALSAVAAKRDDSGATANVVPSVRACPAI